MVIDVLVESALATSKSDAKRLIDQGGVMINNKKVEDGTLLFNSQAKGDAILQVGQRKFIDVKIQK